MVFIDNKYYQLYLTLVSYPDKGEDTEIHHKVPRCLGGSDAKSNLVRLVYRKHFLSHWLLTKCTEGENKKKMFFALSQMQYANGAKRSNATWRYEKAKQAFRQAVKGNTYRKGQKPTEETRKKISNSLKGNTRTLGFKHSNETKALMSEQRKGNKHAAGNKGNKLSPEHVEAIKESWRKRKAKSH